MRRFLGRLLSSFWGWAALFSAIFAFDGLVADVWAQGKPANQNGAAVSLAGAVKSDASKNTESAPASPAPTPETAPGTPVEEKLSPEVEQKMQEAVDLFNKSDIAGALEDLKVAVSLEPRLIPPRLVLAHWFSQQKNQNAVRISLEMATRETPSDPEAFLLLGEIALRQGEWTAAELLFQKAETLLGQYQANPERGKNLTRSLLAHKTTLAQIRQEWTRMQEILGVRLKAEGETPELCRLIGQSFYELEKEPAARQWFLRGDELDQGKGLPADAQMARLALGHGDVVKAKEYLKTALAARPDSVESANLFINIALGENDAATVKQLSEKLLAANPKAPDVLKTCGIVALYQEDFPKAEQLFSDGLAVAPEDPDLINGLAGALCEQNDPAKNKIALERATENVRKQGNNREYLATLGWVLYKSGETDKALAVLQQSTADGQLSLLTAYYLAAVFAEKGEMANAQRLVKISLLGKKPFFKRKAAEELLKKISPAGSNP